MFYPLARENRGDDGGRCFIKDIIHAHMAEGTDQAVHEGGQVAPGMAISTFILGAAAQALKALTPKYPMPTRNTGDADRQLDPGFIRKWMPWAANVQHQYRGKMADKQESLQGGWRRGAEC